MSWQIQRVLGGSLAIIAAASYRWIRYPPWNSVLAGILLSCAVEMIFRAGLSARGQEPKP